MVSSDCSKRPLIRLSEVQLRVIQLRFPTRTRQAAFPTGVCFSVARYTITAVQVPCSGRPCTAVGGRRSSTSQRWMQGQCAVLTKVHFREIQRRVEHLGRRLFSALRSLHLRHSGLCGLLAVQSTKKLDVARTRVLHYPTAAYSRTFYICEVRTMLHYALCSDFECCERVLGPT